MDPWRGAGDILLLEGVMEMNYRRDLVLGDEMRVVMLVTNFIDSNSLASCFEVPRVYRSITMVIPLMPARSQIPFFPHPFKSLLSSLIMTVTHFPTFLPRL